ncbi:MAG: DUF4112 domain-containing protein [Mucilaginibacter polytrichastri]|nr:DUF4112 domain-containing protein [Mucilaginibacter polytrichastri]
MQNQVPSKAQWLWIERIARLMDTRFRLPGTNFRFGLDPIINLVPVIGDIAGFAVSAVLVLMMRRYGVSGKVLVLMLINIAIDALVGVIPLIGYVFDFAFKANERNVRLLKEHYLEGKHQGSGKGTVAMVFIGLLLIMSLLIFLLLKLAEWIAGMS